MSSTYTIRTDLSFPPVQHTQRKVPIEYQEQIKNTLNDMVNKGVVTPVSQLLNQYHPLHTSKSDGTICICLDPKDLNKTTVQEHYKAHIHDEISHQPSGATCFSKLDAKDGFWGIYLDENLPAWSHLIPIVAGTIFCTCHSV